ncbi:MAG: hypothetical protein BMS9Abin29_1445 [Gemmatimonadota bacterium]|nr:MAG: hypothetical protein BMS9Abin29_1445 [Gemmatimonadota bacterium]
MTEILEASGATAISFPTISIEPPSNPEALHTAMRSASYDWVVLTSTNAVTALEAARLELGVDRSPWPGPATRFCAVGPGTAAALSAAGLTPEIVPSEFVGESVLEALLEADGNLERRRILIPRAAEARDVIPDGLRAAGATVDVIEAYRTTPVEADAESTRRLARLLDGGEVDVVTFTSSSTVRAFRAMFGDEMGGFLVATIGPATSATARESGYEVAVEAEEYTISGLVRALESYYAEDATE